MRRLALIAMLAVALSGASCLHEAVAMETTHAQATLSECGHNVSSGQTTFSARLQESAHGSCCIERQATKTEVDDGVAVHALSDAAFSNTQLPTEQEGGAVETCHPPDVGVPFHQRTTCQRE